MDQENRGIKPDALALVSSKGKRGRPRKHPRSDFNPEENAYAARNHNFYRVPAGFDSNGDIVGQPVYGVIEAAFDAGYLITVKVGNSQTILRGVVLKPGHYVPVSAENDVAPNVQMIRRNEIRFTRERNEPAIPFQNGSVHPFKEPSVATRVPQGASHASKFGASRSKQVPVITNNTVPSLTSRGNVVPVMLQPANMPTGGAASSQMSTVISQSADLVSSKAKQVDAPSGTNHTPKVVNRTLPAQTETSHQGMPKGTPTDIGTCNQTPAEMSHKVDANSAVMDRKPFEKLLSEVMKGAESPLQKLVAFSGTSTVKDLGHKIEDAHPISNKPLQAIEPENSTPMFKSLENFGTGKMTELLKAVQENMPDNLAARAKKLASLRGPELGDKETNESVGCPQTSGV